jgi:hypothetical protein
MMLAYRLVRLIETHSDGLAASLLKKVQTSELARDYAKVPAQDVERRVYEIYRHLGDWLLGKSEFDIKQRYHEIGACRAEQQVPLSQLIWVIVLTKENLWEYLKNEAGMERPAEVFGELEMLQLLDQFFDRAIFYASMGYEEVCGKLHPSTGTLKDSGDGKEKASNVVGDRLQEKITHAR